MKKILLILLFVTALSLFARKKTDGFTVERILSSHTFHKEWETAISTAEEKTALEALNQPFFYLGKGAQCYAFASKDGKYVIKCFRHDHMRLPLHLCFLPQSWTKQREERGAQKLLKDFSSYKLAFEELREETALLYLHLNKTDHLKQELTLVDKIGIAHTLSLDGLEFVLQKRADLLYEQIEAWVKCGNVDSVKGAIDTLIMQINTRLTKGISDKDPNIKTNFGIIEGKVVQIDIGRFRKGYIPGDGPERILFPLQYLLDQENKELGNYLRQEIL